MTITARDFFGQEFDPDQYNKIAFEIQTEMTGVHHVKDLLVEKTRAQNRIFKVTGKQTGTYRLTAFVEKANGKERVMSQANKIEVFPLLELYPTDLLLTPNMRYTLSVFGGPSSGSPGKTKDGSDVAIELDIEDRSKATIDAHNEITAHEEGDTKLIYSIIHTKHSEGQEWRSTVSKRSINIRVRLVTAIQIPHNRQRIIYSGSLLKQIAVLKYGQETFSHGIAPLSFSWNCSDRSILKPYLPQDHFEEHQVSGHDRSAFINQNSITLRNNKRGDDQAKFSTQFNSSSIYSKAQRPGEAQLSVRMAIQYPAKYSNQPNWFETSTIIKVEDKLSISVPEFTDQERKTHLYMLPRNALSRISTNREAKLMMGYSMQSVFINTTRTYEYRQSTEPIIELLEGGIRTLDKYGKVTVVMEENPSYSDQVVMLNILITDIYSLAAQNFYEALSLPLGSSIHIPIKFQNEHAHLFAKNIEGVRVGYKLSHPRVVQAQLDAFNSTLTLKSLNSGECNVIIYLEEDPSIYDVFRVRVATLLQPSSPVYLHTGSRVNFKIVEYQSHFKGGEAQQLAWSSTNSSVISVH